MIDFNDIKFKRVAMHQVLAKDADQDHSMAILDNNLFEIDESVEEIIINRLVKASKKGSKAFELEIVDSGNLSFFGFCNQMKTMEDHQFIKASGDLTQHLGTCQTTSSIPSSYVLVIHAETSLEQQVYIVIKAELNEALRYEVHNQVSMIKLLDDVFLTPNQKFYKIGCIFERYVDDLKFPNNEFGCFLYDEQFNIDSKPAEYFYKDFLGLSTRSNAKIQSKKFYINTEKFIQNNVNHYEEKQQLLDSLRNEFLSPEFPDLEPDRFAVTHFQQEEVRDQYAQEVAPYLPSMIVKDTSLIKAKLEKRTINFPHNIKIMGPEKAFDYTVQIIHTNDEMKQVDMGEEKYTVIKILGKPFDDFG
jgi:nucleoid associated protein NdpA